MNFICCPVELCLNLKPLLLRVLASLTVLILHFTFAIAQPAPCPKYTLSKPSFQIRSTLELQDPAKNIYEVKLYLYRDSPAQSKLTRVHIDLPLKYALNQIPDLSLKDSVGLFNSDGKGSCTFQLSADGKTIAADLQRPDCEGIKGEGYLGSFLIKGGNSLIGSGANRFHDGIVEVVIIHGIRPGPDTSENERRREGVQVFPNPTNGVTHIKLPKGEYEKMEIYSQDGRILYRKSITDRQQLKLDLTPLPEGLFFLRVSGRQGTSVTKILVQH